MTAPDSPVDQLSETSRALAASLESQRAALDGMRTRLDSVERQMESARAAQTAGAAQVERLASELDYGARYDALTSQIEALRRAREEDSERLERLATRLGHLDRVEEALGHLRSTTTAEMEEQKRGLLSEIAAVSGRVGVDAAKSARELQVMRDRLGEMSPELARLDPLERYQQDTTVALNSLTVDLQRATDERTGTEEAFSRAEQRMSARVDGLAGELAQAVEEVQGWRARIDAQTETVREARAIADGMGEQAEVLRREHHATAEAQRVAEGRVDAAIEAMHDESEQTWERFLTQRSNERDAAGVASARRDQRLDELDVSVPKAFEHIEVVATALDEAVSGQAESLMQLRRELTELLVRWRDLAGGEIDFIGAGLPTDEQPAVATERREATRRAVRAQRSSSGK